jgi:hypothetical protein
MQRITWLWLASGALALSLGACTTTYTESDLAAEERKQQKQDRREVRTDEQIDAEEGGANAEQLGRDVDEVDQESDL